MDIGSRFKNPIGDTHKVKLSKRNFPLFDMLGFIFNTGLTTPPDKRIALNGDVINARLQHREGRLQRNIEQGQSSAEIVREFYLRGLGRLPDEREQQMWDEQLSTATGDELRRRLEDFVWAMLNSRDFSENH